MDNSLLAVRDINHKYIVVEKSAEIFGALFNCYPQYILYFMLNEDYKSLMEITVDNSPCFFGFFEKKGYMNTHFLKKQEVYPPSF